MSDDLKARLEAAKAARAALKAKAAEVDESTALAEEVAAEERSLKEEQALEKLVEQYGAKKLAKVDTDLGAVILLRSTPVAYKRFAEKTEFKLEDVEALVTPCVKYPTIPEFQEMLREQPGTLLVCANAIAHLAGARKDALSGK